MSEIFDYLHKAGMIKLPQGHRIPRTDEIRGREYCKYHDSWRHSTNGCYVFKTVIQDHIDRGFLKFPETGKKDMGIDKNPFPAAINMVAANFHVERRYTKEEKAKAVVVSKEVAPTSVKEWKLKKQRSARSRRATAVRKEWRPKGQSTSNPKGDLRPWLEKRKKEVRAAAIAKEIRVRQEHALKEVRPRMVRPTKNAPIGVWQRVEHPKFPTSFPQRNRKTWRRRELRRRAKAKKEKTNSLENDVTSLAVDLEKFVFMDEDSKEVFVRIDESTTLRDIVKLGYGPQKAKEVLQRVEGAEKVAREEQEATLLESDTET